MNIYVLEWTCSRIAYSRKDISYSFFNRTYRLFSEYSALLQNLEEYCYYEIQILKALCEFTVKKGYCWLKESLPPPNT
jgi:hypothetical protein